MPNIQSAIKRAKQSEKRRLRNASVRSALRTAVKTSERASAAANDTHVIASAYVLAQKKLDQCARKGIIHRNAAARKASRLARKRNAARIVQPS